jgi:tRNA (guanine-N7-)-methyltransferase
LTDGSSKFQHPHSRKTASFKHQASEFHFLPIIDNFDLALELIRMQLDMVSKPAPLGLIYKLASITERIDLDELFPITQPLEAELGSGDGSFLVNYARLHPERNFIGVERLLGRLRKLGRKGQRAGLSNLCGIRIESSYFLEYLLPRESASALHIYFPDPWPKRKHRRHRLINERFPALANNALAPGGTVFLRTDDRDYFEQMLNVFAASPLFRATETPAELSSIVTDFEATFLARGIRTLRAAYQKLQETKCR